MAKQIEVGALVTVLGVDHTGGVVGVVKGDKIYVVFDGGYYGWFDIADIADNEPVTVGADNNIAIETEVQSDAVTEKQIALIEQELMILPVAKTNRRAVVKSITLGGTIRVSLQVWQRIIPAPHENTVGDTYRWVELKSIRF